MRERIRNLAAIVIVGLCLTLAVPTFFAVQQVTAFTFGYEGSVLVVTAVDPDYYIQGDVAPGMVVSEFDYTRIEDVSPQQLDRFLDGYFKEVGFDNPTWGTLVWSIPEEVGTPSRSVFFIGVALLLGITIWVRRGQAGEALRPFAIPLAAASVVSLILSPSWPFLTWPMIAVGLFLSTLGLLVLADGFVERISRRIPRIGAATLAVAAAIGCVAVAVGELPPRLVLRPGGTRGHAAWPSSRARRCDHHGAGGHPWRSSGTLAHGRGCRCFSRRSPPP